MENNRAENILMAVFPVESEAYQAISELKRDPSGTSFLVSQAVLVKKISPDLKTCESFDTGVDTADDTLRGGLIGSCIGILGGPLGILLGMSLGSLTGAALDAGDMATNASLLEKIAANLPDGGVAILALAQEEDHAALNAVFAKFNAKLTRYDAAEVEDEIEEAEKAQRELQKQARAALRKEKSEERKTKVESVRAKLAQDFAELRDKLHA